MVVDRNQLGLPALPGRRHSAAVALADSGIVVGYAYSRLDENDSPVNARAFVWRAGTLSALPPLPGGGPGEALALNDRGRVVGWAITNRGRPHAVLWMPRHG